MSQDHIYQCEPVLVVLAEPLTTVAENFEGQIYYYRCHENVDVGGGHRSVDGETAQIWRFFQLTLSNLPFSFPKIEQHHYEDTEDNIGLSKPGPTKSQTHVGTSDPHT